MARELVGETDVHIEYREHNAEAGTWTHYFEPKEGSTEHHRSLIQSQAVQAIGRLESDAADKATWDGLTPARRQETSRVAVLAVAKLARLVLGKLDKA